MKLSGSQRQQLRKAIMSAYRSETKLKMMLLEELEIRLNEIGGGSNYGETVFELVDWAESEGNLPNLVGAAYQRNPGNLELRKFVQSFGIRLAPETALPGIEIGPDFTWRGSTDERELQKLCPPQPELWSLAFLKSGIDQAASVCRVDAIGQTLGTGVLIQKTLLLTNYHVIASVDSEIEQIQLRFGYLAEDSRDRRVFKLANNPLLRWSAIADLDYALLKIEAAILQVPNLQPASWKPQARINRNDGISILQHPGGEVMQVALSANGVTNVSQDRVQYVSRTAGGSSGSPCFDRDWQLVALHAAERSTTFGRRGEGILWSAIHAEVADLLTESVE